MEVASWVCRGVGACDGEFKSRAVSLGQGSCSDHLIADFQALPGTGGSGLLASSVDGQWGGGHPEPVLGAGVSVSKSTLVLAPQGSGPQTAA